MIKAGIYKITSIKGNIIYVGSSANLKSRKYQHFWLLFRNRHPNTILQNYYNKYGKDNFKWEILEYIQRTDKLEEFKSILLNREQYYLDTLKSYQRNIGFNISSVAGSTIGNKPSPETLLKRSISLKGRIFTQEHKNKISESHKGKKFSEETKRKMSEKAKNRTDEHIKRISENKKGTRASQETKAKMSKSQRGRKHSEESKKKMSEFAKKYRTGKNNNRARKVIKLTTGEIFDTVLEASLHEGVKHTACIRLACKNEGRLAYGSEWRYLSEMKNEE